MTKLNDKEKRLIMGLRNNGRERINMIAKQYGYPISSMFDTLHRLERDKVLTHKSRVSFEDIGYPTKVFAAFKVSKDQRERLGAYLMDQPCINTIHTVNGGYDYHVEIIGKNAKHAHDIIDDINDRFLIEDISTFDVIETMQYEKFLTQEHHFE